MGALRAACRRSRSTTSPATPAPRSGTASSCWCALPILAGARARRCGACSTPGRPEEPRRPAGVAVVRSIAACGMLIPIVLVAFGADYLAPRNLVAAMIPVTRADRRRAWPSPRAGRVGDRARRDDRRRLPGASRSTSISARGCSAATGAASPRCCAAAVARACPHGGRARSRPSSWGPRRWSTTCRRCSNLRARQHR